MRKGPRALASSWPTSRGARSKRNVLLLKMNHNRPTRQDNAEGEKLRRGKKNAAAGSCRERAGYDMETISPEKREELREGPNRHEGGDRCRRRKFATQRGCSRFARSGEKSSTWVEKEIAGSPAPRLPARSQEKGKSRREEAVCQGKRGLRRKRKETLTTQRSIKRNKNVLLRRSKGGQEGKTRSLTPEKDEQRDPSLRTRSTPEHLRKKY